jgi:small subunit ribosomal protein S6
MVLLDNREVRKGWDTLKNDVSGMLTKHGAEIVSSRLWEERKLAYSIKHQDRGTYLLMYFEAPTNEITPINRELEMAEPVLRHVVTACEAVPESAHEPEAAFDVTKIGEETKPEPAPATEAEKKKDGDKPAAASDAAPAEAKATEDAPAKSDAASDTGETKEDK